MAEIKIIKSPDTERPNRVPPGQRLVDKFPVLHEGPVPAFDPARWSFRVWGAVEKERKLSWAEFSGLPRVRVYSDVHCVTGWSSLGHTWEGVSAGEIKKLVKLKAGARCALVHAHTEYTVNLTVDDFFAEDVLFAISFDREPIRPEHGYPLRLVVPRLYLWKSAKWATGVEFLTEEKLGFWEERGYHHHGDPWKEERYRR